MRRILRSSTAQPELVEGEHVRISLSLRHPTTMIKKIILIVIVIILILHVVTFLIDKSRIESGKKSIFTIPTTFLKDGGTTINVGLGYKTIHWYFLATKEAGDKKINGHKVGFEILHIINSKFFTNFRDLKRPNDKKLKFIPEELGK